MHLRYPNEDSKLGTDTQMWRKGLEKKEVTMWESLGHKWRYKNTGVDRFVRIQCMLRRGLQIEPLKGIETFKFQVKIDNIANERETM